MESESEPETRNKTGNKIEIDLSQGCYGAAVLGWGKSSIAFTGDAFRKNFFVLERNDSCVATSCSKYQIFQSSRQYQISKGVQQIVITPFSFLNLRELNRRNRIWLNI